MHGNKMHYVFIYIFSSSLSSLPLIFNYLVWIKWSISQHRSDKSFGALLTANMTMQVLASLHSITRFRCQRQAIGSRLAYSQSRLIPRRNFLSHEGAFSALDLSKWLGYVGNWSEIERPKSVRIDYAPHFPRYWGVCKGIQNCQFVTSILCMVLWSTHTTP